ncbi:MAG: hypothetical protein COB02_18600 [Candidatus Cloacimonadota bacterium]|nr:MAG: hypothetical protein COB02_18600 [Candidatus Cloacimonadota bacterium]
MNDWMNASTYNKLATSADFVAKLPNLKYSNIDSIKPYATSLMHCIDKVNLGFKVAEIGATCMITLGLNKL